jgi:excisionase family DNA binding protein
VEKNLTPAQAARRLGVTLDAIYRLLYAGKLTATKIGTRWLVREADVLARLKAREKRYATAGR